MAGDQEWWASPPQQIRVGRDVYIAGRDINIYQQGTAVGAMPAHHAEKLISLVCAATVQFDLRQERSGQHAVGVFVAPGIVATCSHAVQPLGGEVMPPLVQGRLIDGGLELTLETVPGWHFQDLAAGPGIIFLLARSAGNVRPVVIASGALPGDPMWTHGQGPDELGMAQGLDGSAVLNLRTGAVCGLLCRSGRAGDAHVIPAAELLQRNSVVAAAQRAVDDFTQWLDLLSDEQARQGPWRYPGPIMRGYLDAAIESAESLPYPGVFRGTVPPPLTAVYLSQKLDIRSPADGKHKPTVADPGQSKIQADKLLTQTGSFFVVGGPGAGKTSLLRKLALDLARCWRQGLDGARDADVPVRILAADVARHDTIPEAIAAGVMADLPASGLRQRLTQEMFAEPPFSGIRWLVLVDGLDEVSDEIVRRKVLAKLAAFTAGRYRVIVTSRDLPSAERPRGQGWTDFFFELQPFTPEELHGFAERWFAELGVPNPAGAADAFMAETRRVHAAELAKVPLMATMMCQLFAENPHAPLPPTRAAVYGEFIGHLREHQYRDDAGQIRERLFQGISRYAPESVVDTLLNQADSMFGHIAMQHITDGTQAALDLLESCASKIKPGSMPYDAWRSALSDLMRRSGVFVQRGDSLVFLHQTIAEYLAARYMTADPQRDASAFAAMTGTRKVKGVTFWKAPPYGESCASFLVSLWSGRPDLRPSRVRRDLLVALSGLASDHDVLAGLFLVRLFIDGACAHEGLRVATVNALSAYATNRPKKGMLVTRWLEACIDPFDLPPNYKRRTPSWIDKLIQEFSYEDSLDELHLARFDATLEAALDPSMSNMLTDVEANMLTDTEKHFMFTCSRADAIRALEQLGDVQVSQLTSMIANEKYIPTSHLTACAKILDGAHAAILYNAVLDRPVAPPAKKDNSDRRWSRSHAMADRLSAAGWLAARGYPRGVEFLLDAVNSLETDSYMENGRLTAANHLAVIGHPRGVKLLEKLSHPGPGRDPAAHAHLQPPRRISGPRHAGKPLLAKPPSLGTPANKETHG